MPIDPELAFAPVRILGQKLRAREITSVALTEFFVDRLDRIGPQFNAVVTVTRKLALQQAADADRELASGRDRGPLHGIPYGAKDLLATKGIPTTWGAAPYRDRVIDEDATVIVRLREAGAVLAAKLSMVEIAGGFGYRQADAAFTGPGLCAWDRRSWSGGSSCGSGSAVGAGLVPFAIGTETWGSITTPAGYCGVTGLRPTFGRVSRHGAMALSWSMDKIGALGRTVDDCGLVLNAIAGPDANDPDSASRPFRYPSDEAPRPPFRIATLRGAADHVQPEVKANYEQSLDALRKFATLEDTSLPDLPYSAVASTILHAEASAAFEGMIVSGEVWDLTALEDRPGGHAGLFIPAKDYINALRIRGKLQRSLDEFFARFDAVVTPTLATVAPPIDRSFASYQRGFRGTAIGGAGNVVGLPAITIPNGFGDRGLPTALQFVARAFDDVKLIAIAAAYQSATEWHQRHPAI
jgi:aspartyl-tRNA(Asn)/glutamyl-tRNA(Gln) amidotransferase subunit A